MDINGLLRTLEAIQRNDADLVKRGAITYEEAGRRAAKLGQKTGQEIYKYMRELYPEGVLTEGEALEIIPPALRSNYKHVVGLAEAAQQQVNDAAEVGLKPLVPEFDQTRADNLAKYVASKEDFTQSKNELLLQVEENSRHIIDESIQINSQAHESAGLRVRVIRRYDGVGLHDGKHDCQWCKDRAGEWTVSQAKANGVFERHPGCGCEILYETIRGNWQRQRRSGTWENIQDQATLERRKQYGRR